MSAATAWAPPNEKTSGPPGQRRQARQTASWVLSDEIHTEVHPERTPQQQPGNRAWKQFARRSSQHTPQHPRTTLERAPELGRTPC
jgi:hypothetical protein